MKNADDDARPRRKHSNLSKSRSGAALSDARVRIPCRQPRPGGSQRSESPESRGTASHNGPRARDAKTSPTPAATDSKPCCTRPPGRGSRAGSMTGGMHWPLSATSRLERGRQGGPGHCVSTRSIRRPVTAIKCAARQCARLAACGGEWTGEDGEDRIRRRRGGSAAARVRRLRPPCGPPWKGGRAWEGSREQGLRD